MTVITRIARAPGVRRLVRKHDEPATAERLTPDDEDDEPTWCLDCGREALFAESTCATCGGEVLSIDELSRRRRTAPPPPGSGPTGPAPPVSRQPTGGADASPAKAGSAPGAPSLAGSNSGRTPDVMTHGPGASLRGCSARRPRSRARGRTRPVGHQPFTAARDRFDHRGRRRAGVLRYQTLRHPQHLPLLDMMRAMGRCAP